MLNRPGFPADLDALVAAPQHHTLLFENQAVRVLDTRVPRGHTVPLHTHCWPGTLYLLSWSDFIRRDAEGSILLDSRTLPRPAHGSAFWSAAMPPHTLENIGASDLHLISIELKSR
jgi:hypothetical protein